MDNCNEIFLSEVVHVELVLASACTMPVPFNVSELTSMDDCIIGAATMVMDMKDGMVDGMFLSAPTLKTQEKSQAAGYIREHSLQVPIYDGYEAIRKKKGVLAGSDFHVIMKTIAGTEFLIYALPNSSTISVEDQFGGDSKQTVKVSLQSMSNMIRISRKANS